MLFLQLSSDLILFLLKVTHVSSEMPRRYPSYPSSFPSPFCHSSIFSGLKETTKTEMESEALDISFCTF